MDETAIWQEPVRGGYPDPRILALPGIEQLRSYFRGLSPRPPISRLTGCILTDVGPGTSTFTMPASPWLVAPPGLVHPGALAILADGPLGCAIHTSLAPMTPYATAELSMNYARPVVPDGGTLIGRGRLILAGRSLGLSEVAIEDARGRLVAHGTSRCVIFPPLGPAPDEPPVLEQVKEPADDDSDPYRRPVRGEPVPQEVWDRMSGLEILRAHLAEELPNPPLYYLVGLRAVDADEGRATFALPATEWLNSPLGRPQGGAIALLAETTVSVAVQTTVPAGTTYAPVDLKVNFLRPAASDGRDLTARGTVMHRGRSIAVASAEVIDADGKRVAMATGTSMILPGRPWTPEPPVVQADEPADRVD